MKKINIAIDGPAGAGKSTIAKNLAKDRNMANNTDSRLYIITLLFFFVYAGSIFRQDLLVPRVLVALGATQVCILEEGAVSIAGFVLGCVDVTALFAAVATVGKVEVCFYTA